MRIIAGGCRKQALQSLPGEDTRPTLNRVKEGMFSAVQAFVPGAQVLDLFAGSGQLGLEALSRGATFCQFVDSAPAAVRVVRSNVDALGFSSKCHVNCADAQRFLATCNQQFDLVLLDPPFRFSQWQELLETLSTLCKEGAQLLCETDAQAVLPQAVGELTLQKQYRYGTVRVWRYSKCV